LLKIDLHSRNVLYANGWTENRSIDISDYEQHLKDTGQPVSDTIRGFLRLFGGIKINQGIDFDPIRASRNAGDNARYERWIGKPLCIVGSYNPAVLLMSLEGEIYSVFDKNAALMGSTIDASLNALLSGGKPVMFVPLPRDLAPVQPVHPSKPLHFKKGIENNNEWDPVLKTVTVHEITFEMCRVPPGSFVMGNNEASYDTKPAHDNFVPHGFWIAVHPVTNEQWRWAVEKSAGRVKQPRITDWYSDAEKAQSPVVWIDWYQCQTFTTWLGKGWRLPTEVEWEYAVRGSSDVVLSHEQHALADFHHYEREGPITRENNNEEQTWVGAYNMTGRVLEWTNSQYRPYPYNSSDGREDLSNAIMISLRGLDGINRSRKPPKHSYNNTGLRICIDKL
jgi:hypothetical protein